MKRFIPICLALIGLLGLSCDLSTLPLVNQTNPTITLPPTNTPLPTPAPSPTATLTPLPATRIEEADRLLLDGNYAKALEDNQLALQQAKDDENRARALYGIGKTQVLASNCGGAIQALTTLIEKIPDSDLAAPAHYFLGKCYHQQNNPSRAVEEFQRYLALRPGLLDAFIQELRGDALQEAGNTKTAIEAYEAAKQAPQLGNTRALDVKIGRAYAARDDHENAVRRFMSVYEQTPNDYTKAQMDLLLGQSYKAMGLPEQEYARYQDAINNYPKAYDSYTSLVALLDANQPVSELNRGIVDYYAGQYAVAAETLAHFINATPDHTGASHYYRALSLQSLGSYDKALEEWDALIRDHQDDHFWISAWDEKAYTLWANQGKYKEAAATLLQCIKQVPTAQEAPAYLFEAGRIFERGDLLQEAAETWARLINEYATADVSPRALFLSGITYYRMGKYDLALTTFQRSLVLGGDIANQAASHFWIAKTQQAQNKNKDAAESMKQAADADPGGYYGERARDLLLNMAPFSAEPKYNLTFNQGDERHLGELWLKRVFKVDASENLSGLGTLASDARLQRGDAFWELGLYLEAQAEFDSLRQEVTQDAVANFRLLNHLVDLGFYQQSIYVSRQILSLANLSDADTFTAPDYFNHIRFGPFFNDIVLDAAKQENFHPLFIFPIIRQESMFNRAIQSSAGAIGLMQIMPDTGQEIAGQLNWPPNYSSEDLYRPLVNIRFGAHYLARWRDYFGKEIYALAAYNGGPGNVTEWKALAKDDPDLFLEVIRAAETRTYIMQISEFMYIYRKYYTREK